MDFKEAIEVALQGESLLFIGAGFSIGAIAVNGNKLLTAPQLAQELCRLCDCDATDNLMDAADDYIDATNDLDEVVNVLSSHLKVKNTEYFHREIASVPWRCVFTTNYDNAYELASLEIGKDYKAITLSNVVKNIGKNDNIVVHLNGMIETLNKSNIHDEFKLSDSSYLTNDFMNSEWYDKFIREAEIARSIFFIGYSMYDIDIKKILSAHPALKEKTFFIIPSFSEDRTKRTVSKFGKLIEKTTEEFSKDIISAKSNFQIKEKPELFTSFEIMNYNSYSTNPQTITNDDAFELFFYGKIDRNKIYHCISHGECCNYYIIRKELGDIMSLIQNTNTQNILIQSEFGNGKTLLIEGIKASCARAGIPCAQLIEENEDTSREIDRILQNTKKQVVIFDGYHKYLKSLKHVCASRPTNTVAIITERTAFYDIYHGKLSGIMDIDSNEGISVIKLDTMDQKSVESIINCFEAHGFWQDLSSYSLVQKNNFINNKCNASIANTLLEALKSQDISNRLKEVFGELNKNAIYRDITVSACILLTVTTSFNVQTILDIIKKKMRNTIVFESNPAYRQLFDQGTYRLSFKSPILARHILTNLTPADTIVSILIKIYTYFSEKRSTPEHFSIMREFDKFSTIQSLLPDANKLQSASKYFDAIGGMNGNTHNFHYWLQYAIAKTVYDDFDQAGVMFKSAYSYYAKKHPGQYHNMLDNHYARFLLLRATKGNHEFSDYSYFKEANTIVQRQIHHPKETLHFPYRCSVIYSDYFKRMRAEMSPEENDHFTNQVIQILKKIDSLPDPVQNYRDILKTKSDLTSLLKSLDN